MGRESDLLPGGPQVIQDAMSIAAALESQSKALANLSMHSQRLSRQFERTVIRLRDLQKSRRALQEQQLDDVLNIMEMVDSKGETYDPAADGFVFSEAQIEESVNARYRNSLAAQAQDFIYESAS